MSKNRLTIGGKLYLTAGLIALIFVVIGGIFAYGEFEQISANEQLAKTQSFLSQAEQSKVGLLLVRRREKDFLLRMDPKYLKNHKEDMGALHEKIQYLESNALNDEILKESADLRKAADQYNDSFNKMVQEIETLGLDEKSGLQGKLRNAVHQIESSLEETKNLPLSVSMLTLRRREKDFILRRDEKYINALNEDAQHFSSILADSSGIPGKMKSAIAEHLKNYVNTFNEFASITLNVERLKGEVSKAARVLEPIQEKFVKDSGREAELATADRERSKSFVRILMTAVLGLGGLLIVVIILFTTNSINKPIRRIVEGVAGASGQVNSAAEQIASAAQFLAESASEQAASLEETASSLEEMASMSSQNAENATSADHLVLETISMAEQGGAAMKRMGDAIVEIKAASNKTADIIKNIDEIAFQTNLLALNAAVEAARAGDAGRGFAVVAEEVRTLAQRSAEAAKGTDELIKSSQEKSNLGVKVAEEVESFFKDIQEAIHKINELVRNVAAASKEQSSGVTQINQAVSQMDVATQSNAANAEEASSTSNELSAQAQEMNSMVAELSAMVGHLMRQQNNRSAMGGDWKEDRNTSSGSGAFELQAEGRKEGNGGGASEDHPLVTAERNLAAGNLRKKIEAERTLSASFKPEQYPDLTDDDFMKS